MSGSRRPEWLPALPEGWAIARSAGGGWHIRCDAEGRKGARFITILEPARLEIGHRPGCVEATVIHELSYKESGALLYEDGGGLVAFLKCCRFVGLTEWLSKDESAASPGGAGVADG